MTLNTENTKNEEGNLLPGDLLPSTSYLIPDTCYLGGVDALTHEEDSCRDGNCDSFVGTSGKEETRWTT